MAEVTYIAERYATALFEAATERGSIDRVQHALENAARAFDDKEIVMVMEHPMIDLRTKDEVIKKITGGEPLVGNLLGIAIKKRRIDLLSEIRTAFAEMKDDAEGIERPDVISSSPLSGVQKDEIIKLLGEALGKKIVMNESDDPSLLGGMIIKIKDEVLDLSLSSRLESLRRKIISGA